MTQNTYTGSGSSMAGTGRTQNLSGGDSEHQSSNEIRADIDHTRASVGEKIDQLQARLDPNRLKAQAQETVQEMLSDTANSMTEYVRTHKDEMVSSLTDAARRNPLPTALIGLGLGWLVLESMGGNKRRDDDDYYEYERRNFRPRRRSRYDDSRYDDFRYEGSRFEGSTGRSVVSQGRGQWMEGDDYSPAYYDAPDYARGGYPTQSTSGAQYQGRQEFNTDYSREYGNGHHRNPLEKAADAVKDTMSNVTDEVKDTVSNVTGEIKDRVEDATHELKERVGDMRDDMKNRMGEMRGDMRDQAMRFGDEGQQRMQRMERRAMFEGRRRGRQMMRNLEDNPLTYGALALAAGAALAMLLPQTRTENRYFGEMRDELMDRGQEAFESARTHVQEVVEEVRPELESKARELVSEATELGKEVVKEAKDEMKPIVDKAVAKGKEEARSAAQEIGVDPDKLTGSTPALNRDTMAGQWKQIRGDVKSKWGKLTDDDLTRIEGDYEKLVGSLQTRYGHTREQVEREIKDFFSSQKV